MKKRDILKIANEEVKAVELLIQKGNISKAPKNKLEKTIENYISLRSNDLHKQGILISKEQIDFFEVSLEDMLKEDYPEYFNELVLSFRQYKKVPVELRFKYVIEEVNNTGNSKWSHYEKHWKLQYSNIQNLKTDKREWSDVEDVYVIRNSDGTESEISFEEYEKLLKKNKG